MLQLIIGGALGFIAGFITRIAINASRAKRKIKLENEMLQAHSRILSLQKKVSDLETENVKLRDNR